MNKKELLRTIKFTLFSISAGVIEILIFSLLNYFTHLSYSPKYIIALFCSVLWNFTLNREFTFKSANNIYVAMFKILIFYLIFTPTSALFGRFLANKNINEIIVTIINMLINFVTEYLYDRFFVFGKSIDTKKK